MKRLGDRRSVVPGESSRNNAREDGNGAVVIAGPTTVPGMMVHRVYVQWLVTHILDC